MQKDITIYHGIRNNPPRKEIQPVFGRRNNPSGTNKTATQENGQGETEPRHPTCLSIILSLHIRAGCPIPDNTDGSCARASSSWQTLRMILMTSPPAVLYTMPLKLASHGSTQLCLSTASKHAGKYGCVSW